MSSYPPVPQRKNCNCEDPCVSTDDVYYAGPNLPNSGVNTNDILTSVIEKLDNVNNVYPSPTLSYKVYTALLKRTGATVNPPIVLENTIGAITLSYDALGIYSLNSSGLFTLDKTVVFVTNQPNGMFGVVLNASRITSNLVQIIQTTDAYTNDNDWIAPVSIEIRVYN